VREIASSEFSSEVPHEVATIRTNETMMKR
jgi:hypothetical protein